MSPPLALGLSAVFLSRLWGTPYVFHVPDLQPDAALDLGMLPTGRLSALLYGLERFAYRHAAIVSTLTVAMRTRIVSKGIPSEKVTLLPDWADPPLFDVALAGGGTLFRQAFGLEGKFLVVHAGNMGIKQGLDVVLQAAEHSRRYADILFLLVGDGAARPALEKQAAERGLPNLRFLPLQPRTMFEHLLAAADVCLVTQRRSIADIVFPSKVMTLLAAGRPIVASVNGGSEVARIVTSARGGLVVPPEDPRALSDALAGLRADARGRATMSENGRAYAHAQWNRDQLLERMETALLAVGSGKRLVSEPATARIPRPIRS